MGCLKDERLETLSQVMDGLMSRYENRVPDVATVVNAMLKDGLIGSRAEIENDHIAFRTIGVKNLGIQSLEKIFLHYGYQRMDNYQFEAKKLNAYWYAPPADHFPRIFISELKVKELSTAAQRIIYSYTNVVGSDPVDALDLDDAAEVDCFLHHSLWKTPTWEDYKYLRNESEYAAWTIFNRYYLNHFTVSVHNLPERANTIEKFNEFVLQHGVTLNDAGGQCKISRDGKLKQSSSVAQLLNVEFQTRSGGTIEQKISGSYVEFAERQVLPQYEHLPQSNIARQHRREGFETKNADKIFESTFQSQLKKKAS